MEKQKGKMGKKIGIYYMVYTLFFVFVSIGIFFVFIKEGRSFIWMHDGYEQNFPLFSYMSEYYKNILSELIANGKITFPMIDLSLGFGVDIISTLNFYVFGDPLLLFTVFFPKEQIESTYHVFILLRLYLAGAAFSSFCFYHKRDGFSILVGSLVYVFCGYALFGVIRHPHFATPMIYLPLLLLAVDKLLKEKKSYFFTFIVFLIALTNFYYLYKLTIIAIAYGSIRFYQLYQGKWKKNFLSIVVRVAINYLLGVSTSAVILLPSIMGYLKNPRAGSLAGLTDSLLHYDFSYYENVLFGFLTPMNNSDYWTVLNFASIVPIAIVLLFLEKKKHGILKIGFLMCLMGICIPYIGRMMNGFGYVTNRWVFAFSFVLAIIVVWMLPTMQKISFRQINVISAILILTMIYAMINIKYKNIYTAVGVGSILLTCGGLFLAKKLSKVIILFMVIASLWLNAYFLYAPEYGNYANEYLESATVFTEMDRTPYGITKFLEKDEFYRVSASEMTATNLSLSLKFYGNNSYYSINDQRIYDNFTQLEFGSLQFAHRFLGLNGRTIAEALASTKYYIVAEGEEALVPYGYKLLKKIERPEYNRVDLIYENEYALPLGYTYNSYITYSEYESLNAIEKQQAMLQAAVIKDSYANETKVAHATVILIDQEIPFQLGVIDGITYVPESNTLTVQKAGGAIQLLFNGLENSESYIRLEDFSIDGSGLEIVRGIVEANGDTRSYWATSKENSFDSGCENFLINLGYNKESENYCTLWFPVAGSFLLGDIQIYSLPMDSYPKEVSELGLETLEKVEVSINKIVGQIHVSKNKILTLSIPYSEGWSAKVDGEYAELLEANTMYMGIELEAGNHEIELTYRTPGIALGGMISIVGMFLFLLSFCYHGSHRMIH